MPRSHNLVVRWTLKCVSLLDFVESQCPKGLLGSNPSVGAIKFKSFIVLYENMTKENYLKDAANMFGELIPKSKKEAFLNGYLCGLGCDMYVPNLDLVAKDPETFVPIEKDRIDIHKSVREDEIENAKEMLRKIYNEEGRQIPKWLR